MFEKLLIEWIVACNQLFDEVEKPEFVSMMEYKWDPTKFSLPKKDGVRWRIMTLGENTIEDTKAMFVVRDSFISFGATIVNLFNELCSRWREKSASPLMLGHLVMVTHFWQLLLIMWETMDSMVWVAFKIYFFFAHFSCRGASDWFSWAHGSTLWRKHGSCCMVDIETLWDRE